jgi:hypothetical protein
MDPLADIRTLVTVGGVFASLAGAWFLMKYQIGELRDSDTEPDRNHEGNRRKDG